MKNKFTFTFIFFLITSISYSQHNWVPVGPGAGSDLEAMAVHPENPDVVYIGGDIEGIFKTTDGGASWKNINSNLASEYTSDIYFIQEIIFDPFDNNYHRLYICTQVGLFVTTDGGGYWQRLYPAVINSEEDYIPVSYIAVDPSNENILWAGIGSAHTDENGIGTIIKSTDRGATWAAVQVLGGSSVIHGIFIDPQSPVNNRIIYISTSDGIFKSTNNGTSWAEKNTGLPHVETRRLRGVYDNNSLVLFVSLNTQGNPSSPSSFRGGLYKSTDGGGSWYSINGNLPTFQTEEALFYYYWKFCIDPSNINIIYTATTRSMPEEGHGAWENMGVYKTTNSGNSWSYISNNINFGWMNESFSNELHAFVLEVAPSKPDIVYWGLVWMKKSTDAGNTWHQIYTKQSGNTWQSTGLELMAVEDMTFDPAEADIVYISYDDFGPLKSTDGGLSFTPLDTQQDPYDGYDAAKELIVDEADNSHIYLSRYEGLAGSFITDFQLGQMWFSSDGGLNWNKKSNGLPDGKPYLIMDDNSGSPGSRTLYCTIFREGIFKTTNSGSSWAASNSGLGADKTKAWTVCISPVNSNLLYLGLNGFGNGGGMYKSTDAGANWSKLTNFPNMDVMTIEIDKAGNVYAGANDNFDWQSQGGLYKSTDNGANWNQVLIYSRIFDIEIDPGDNNKIFAAQQSWYLFTEFEPGVYYSTDGGLNWESISANLPHRFIKFLKINPHNSRQIFAGTDGGGVFKLDLFTTIENKENLPDNFFLHQNYPNPFNPSTIISYSLPAASNVTLKVFNTLGEVAATLIDNEWKEAGYHNYQFPIINYQLPSGVYFYQLQAGEFSQTRKFTFIK